MLEVLALFAGYALVYNLFLSKLGGFDVSKQ